MVDFGLVYKGKKVFVTGHTGFKGSWLVAWLHLLGAEVKGYALAPENSFDLFNTIQGDQLCSSVLADIRDKARVKHEVIDFQPDFIFHLAAQPLVRFSYECPAETFDVNAMGTANLLDAVRFLEKPCVVICITTDKVYENKEWHYPYRENDRLGGYDPYSASKAAAEIVIASYRSSFFNPKAYNKHKKSIAAARAGNVIGGGDWAKDRIIPDIVRALGKKETITVRNPQAVRPWQHVLEPLSGYLQLGVKMSDDPIKCADVYNFGPYIEDTLTVRDLVEIAIHQFGYGDFETPPQTNQPHEAGLLKLDINKAMNELGWKPKWNAQRAIEETINWYKIRTKEYTFAQINAFGAL
jgi:CDP-glucose 4,6-dehydratase